MYNGMYTEGGREGGRGGGGMKGGRDWEKEEKRESERENTYLFCKLVGDTYIYVRMYVHCVTLHTCYCAASYKLCMYVTNMCLHISH